MSDALVKLREPIPAEQISKLPRGTCRECKSAPRKVCDRHTMVWDCGECKGHHSSASIHLDYVGHADVTARLLDVDPEWTWEPVALDPNGMPAFDDAGGLWIRLTVAGVSRLGYGDAAGKSGGDAVKECIGDAIRNAAMRFGVALALWSKSDRDSAPSEPAATQDRRAVRGKSAGDDAWQVPPIEKALQAVAAMTDLEKLARLEHLAGQYVDGEHWTAEDYTRFTEAAAGARERIGWTA